MYTTEVTQSNIPSDLPLLLRTSKAYELLNGKLEGKVLEVGCGEGYGISKYYNDQMELTVIDKSKTALYEIKKRYTGVKALYKKLPSLKNMETESFDVVICFQCVEHIKNDHLLLREIYRVLKKGGLLFLTTPNKHKTVAPNPWHYREYNHEELSMFLSQVFEEFKINGINGSPRISSYYRENEKSVKNMLRFDVFGVHRVLPRSILKLPYEVLNRINRKKLLVQNEQMINAYSDKDYFLSEVTNDTYDFFCRARK